MITPDGRRRRTHVFRMVLSHSRMAYSEAVHRQTTEQFSGRAAVAKFPWLHTFVGNMKRMILGTYHWVWAKHVDAYLAEFVYRAYRRWSGVGLFDRLIAAALNTKASTYNDLITGAT